MDVRSDLGLWPGGDRETTASDFHYIASNRGGEYMVQWTAVSVR